MENETCYFQYKDPSVHFNTKEIDNKMKSINDALHDMYEFQYHCLLLDSSYASQAGRRRKAQFLAVEARKWAGMGKL